MTLETYIGIFLFVLILICITAVDVVFFAKRLQRRPVSRTEQRYTKEREDSSK